MRTYTLWLWSISESLTSCAFCTQHLEMCMFPLSSASWSDKLHCLLLTILCCWDCLWLDNQWDVVKNTLQFRYGMKTSQIVCLALQWCQYLLPLSQTHEDYTDLVTMLHLWFMWGYIKHTPAASEYKWNCVITGASKSGFSVTQNTVGKGRELVTDISDHLLPAPQTLLGMVLRGAILML